MGTRLSSIVRPVEEFGHRFAPLFKTVAGEEQEVSFLVMAGRSKGPSAVQFHFAPPICFLLLSGAGKP
jgi:hypothetical protein